MSGLLISSMSAYPNAELVAGLRELADFLEGHPELPEVSAYVSTYLYTSQEPRETLTAVAATLGERAHEEVERGDVRIRAEFGPVKFSVGTSAKYLGAVVPEPTYDYEPIIKTPVV